MCERKKKEYFTTFLYVLEILLFPFDVSQAIQKQIDLFTFINGFSMYEKEEKKCF